jgi:hypothetical protein
MGLKAVLRQGLLHAEVGQHLPAFLHALGG